MIKKIKKGAIIALKDADSIIEASQNGGGIQERIDHRVISVQHVKSNDIWIDLASLDGGKTLVMFRSPRHEPSYILAKRPEWFRDGTKRDLTESNDACGRFLFEEPKNLENFKPKELELTREITFDSGEVFIFESEFYGDFMTSAEEIIFGGVSFYQQKNGDGIVVICESGGIDKRDGKMLDEGSFIQFLLGKEIEKSEVEIY